MPWWTWALIVYGLVGGAMLLILLSSSTTKAEVRLAWRDSMAWPFWALVFIVEAAEEARRSIIRDRVE